MTDGAANTELWAGVRKPPRKETAGSGTRSCRGRYGDCRIKPGKALDHDLIRRGLGLP
jgi:hypothetical protein